MLRNGRHTLESLLANPDVDLLITDVMIPEMDGRELIGVIRGNTELSDLLIIIISGVVSPKEIAGLLKLGATLFLPKPLSKKNIKEYINRCLE